MLENLSEKVRECYQRAEECERIASEQKDGRLKDDFLASAKSWIVLAHSYEFAERLERFSNKKRA